MKALFQVDNDYRRPIFANEKNNVKLGRALSFADFHRPVINASNKEDHGDEKQSDIGGVHPSSRRLFNIRSAPHDTNSHKNKDGA